MGSPSLALLGGTPQRSRPFPGWPVFDDAEERALVAVLRSGKWWRFSYGEGVELREPPPGEPRSQVAEFQAAFARAHGARHGIACANGTAALEIALKALGIGPGDEVIVPAYTYVATATAVLMMNAVPIFADIEPDTYNLSLAATQAALTPRTRAIIPVHFGGQMADMEPLVELARARGIAVVEDAAHAHGASYRGIPAGSLGAAGTFSFQASKNMTAGEGGIITTNDAALAARCESYVWAGREAGRPWYEHYRLGWNYRLTEFQGAILRQQLARLAEQNARRMANAAYLNTLLAQIPGIRPLSRRLYADRHSYHLYLFRYDAEVFGLDRNTFLRALAAEGIPCIGGYTHPLYRNPMFLNRDFYPRGCPFTCGHYPVTIDYAEFAARCPVAEQACREAVWLEHRLLLGEREDMDDIVAAVAKIYRERSACGTAVRTGSA